MADAGVRDVAVRTGALVRAAERGLPAVPGLFDVPVSEVIGTLACALAPRARAAVIANLHVVAPGRANAATARSVFVEQARNYLEIFRLPRMRPEVLIEGVERRGWEHFLAAHGAGRGVIIASAHLGPVSVVGQILVAYGIPTVLTVEPERSEFQRAVNRGRAAMGIELVRPDAPLAIVRALRAGKTLALVADRAVSGVGERVPFFGREALLPSAHVALALRTGAPLLPAFAGREGRRLFASFEPPLELRATGDRAADVREGVRRWALVLERYVGRDPERWTVFERVWERTAPPRAAARP